VLGDLLLIGYVLGRSAATRLTKRFGDDRAEGVISTAIAVLIVAFLGAALYLIFTQILTSSGSKASTTVDNIGNGG
jgi:drug/metabolite transporter (DMT)-like permease